MQKQAIYFLHTFPLIVFPIVLLFIILGRTQQAYRLSTDASMYFPQWV